MSLLNTIRTGATKHSAGILMGFGIAGFFTAGIMAVSVTPKAIRLLDEEKEIINEQLRREADISNSDSVTVVEKLKPLDVVKITWKCYLPPAIIAAISTGCIIGSSKIQGKKYAALATAYALSEDAIKSYQQKVVETIGEKKEKAIHDEVANDIIQQRPVEQQEIIVTGCGESLCFDVASSRYFYSDIEKIKRAENELNRRLRDEMYISLNDLYYEIGLERTSIGDDIGWNIDRDGYLDLTYSSKIATNGKPCLVVNYTVGPRYDYRDLH